MAASFSHPEDGESTFLRNIDIFLPGYTESHCRRYCSSQLPPQEPQLEPLITSTNVHDLRLSKCDYEMYVAVRSASRDNGLPAATSIHTKTELHGLSPYGRILGFLDRSRYFSIK
jgi:hypothetical protein